MNRNMSKKKSKKESKRRAAGGISGEIAEKSNRKSFFFREALSLSLRSIRLLRQYCPGVFLAQLCSAAVSAVSPYVTIYLSARLLGELAGLRRTEQVWFWVSLFLGMEAALGGLRALFSHWETGKKELFYQGKNKIFMDKLLHMDYIDIEKQETQDLLVQIWQNEMWMGLGLARIVTLFGKLVQAAFGIGGAIALTASLFLQPVPADTGRFVLLNHPGFLAGLLVLLALVTVAAPFCAYLQRAEIEKIAKKQTFANRLLSFFNTIARMPAFALDIRMYNESKVANQYLEEENVFGVGSEMARISTGRLGILAAVGTGISSLFTGIVYLFTCLKAWAGAFGVGSVTQYVGAATALSGYTAKLVEGIGELYSNLPFLQMVYQFLDIPNGMYQGSLTTEKRADRQYEIEFRDVSFRYPGAKNWALRHVSLRFRVGSRLAVVGENGSGKSTFIKLLCRLYDPQEGQILLNGIDIRKYDYRDYMGIFSVVFQDSRLLAQPLGDNVAGSQSYEPERVLKSLRDAGLAERLAELPEGLGTYLYKEFGRNGIELSGGEAQKVAIARALYKDAPFLILDEPTAALDPIAEAEIYSRFDKIAGDKTAVYISHRLSSCKFCEEILVFSEGTVVQKGRHEELLAETDGKYFALWNAQAQYYVEGVGKGMVKPFV